MKQSECVVAIIKAVRDSNPGLSFEDVRAESINTVAAGLQDGTIPWAESASVKQDDKKCLGYAKSLVSNYSKKNKELNGGVAYIPATKRGPQDEMLSQLKTLIAAARVHKPDAVDALQARFEARKSELIAARTTSKVMSASDLAAALANFDL